MTATAQNIDQVVKPGYLQEGELDNRQALENWHRYLYAKWRGHLEYTETARRNENMYLGGGKQWTEEDKSILRSQGRPFYEFNQIKPSINTALGYQIHNRMDIAFRPRGERGDPEVATLLNKVVKQILDSTSFQWHETQVFGDGLIEQRGYFDLRMNFDRNIKGEVDLGTLDPRDVIPDPDAKSYDPDDWSDVLITRWLTLDEIEGLYGQQARDRAEGSGDESSDWGFQDGETERSKFGNIRFPGQYDAFGKQDDGLKRYRIIDRQRFVFEMTECLVNPLTGDVTTMANLSQDSIDAALSQGAIKTKRMRKRVRWVVATYSTTLFDNYSPYDHYTVIPYFAYFRRGETRGMVDDAIGPQEALNKALSQNVHIVNSAANSGWVVEENSLTNISTEDLNDIGAKTGLVIEYKKGSTPPQKIQPNQVPTGIEKLIDRATKALKDVTVPDAMRGQEGNAVSGIAKQADQFASQQQLAVPLDNLTFTRHMLAKRIIKLIQRYYDSHRVFRITETDPITGKPTQSLLEINKYDPETGAYINDVTVGEYDAVITEQPMQVSWENSQFNQALEMRKTGVAIPDATVIRYSALADKHQIMDQMAQQSQPADPTIEAKVKLIEAQTRKADAETVSKAVETQYSGIQTAQVIANVPATAPLADKLLRSAGYQDRDAAPIVPQADAAPMQSAAMPHNTNPMTPANPGVGLNQGIETQGLDGIRN
ncbi:genomic island protein [Aquabacterium sp.]|uniref:portal protein n=1 Tax=Aquabacterium sp. TaxID=1872578 RepID=UPI0035B226AC